MIKKTITFEDLDGNPVEETFYFNLTKMELADASMGADGGLGGHLQRIIEGQDKVQLLTEFKRIILMCVGKRSDDNKRFIKNPEITAEFEQTEAFGVLYFELMKNADAAIEFIKGVVPKDLSAQVDEQTVLNWTPPVDEPALVTDLIEIEEAKGQDRESKALDITKYTREELLEMPQELFDELAGTDTKKMHRSVLALAFQRRAAQR